MLDDSTTRIVWGLPKRAEDIDVKTGARHPANLLPETYSTGCPQLSPQHDRLLFSVPSPVGASQIHLSSSPDGAGAVAVTPGIEPAWLRNGKEFAYSIDPYHVAIFSLPTMSFALLPDPGLGGGQVVSDKVASTREDLLAVQFVDEDSRTAIAVYEGGAPSLKETVIVPSVYEMSFDLGDRLLVSYRPSRRRSMLAQLDWRQSSFQQLGRYSGFELLRSQRVASGGLVVLARQRSKDAWLYTESGSRKVTTDGETYSAAISSTGDLLLGRSGEDGALVIWRQGHDGVVRQITKGPMDATPDFAPDGKSWTYVDYARKSIMVCTGVDSASCRAVRVDDHVPSWPRFSPDGLHLAYATQAGTQRVMVISLKDRGVREIGPSFAQCPPVWSGPATLWVFEGSPKNYRWIERDAHSGAATGERIELGDTMNDAIQHPDESWPSRKNPSAVRFPRLRIETEESFNLIRLGQD
jgi:hypothetical protein